MIRYPIDFDELERAVDTSRPTWRARAAATIERMWASRPRQFDDSGPSWSEIKTLYIERQSHKCAYCERTLEGEDYGAIEHDIEHYRPKQAVRAWAPDDAYAFELADGNPRGYCMLAYELRNYCAACKTCNSTLKGTCFPIAGRQGRADARDIAALNKLERPLLPYPIGDIDEDPERLITFLGIFPVPRTKSGHRHRRARVTIDLFALARRSELLRGRSELICHIWLLLENAYGDDASDDQRDDARFLLARFQAGSMPHTSCARAFVRLFQNDPETAYAIYKEALEQREPLRPGRG